MKGRKITALLLLCLTLAGCAARRSPETSVPAEGMEQESENGGLDVGVEQESGNGGLDVGVEQESGNGGLDVGMEQESGNGGLDVGMEQESGNGGLDTDTDAGMESGSRKREPENGQPGDAIPDGAYRGGVSSATGAEQSSTEAQATAENAASTVEPADAAFDFTICFAGDINLGEDWSTTRFLDEQPDGIYDCISPELVEAMQAADIMCLNNEFTYSTGGAPLPGKAYTFRAAPERVEVLGQLGVDAVTLANNHVYDYGKEALLDTFAVLEEARMPYFGAGRTLEEAMRPLYLEVEGRIVALVAASRAEKNKMTPQATDTEPGILRCYDTELFLRTIREARENADFCIAFVHWGTEYSFELEQAQTDTGREYLDAGADAVIGAHSHCLQGIEYYDGKPIIYSLGNYWFNQKTLDTMLLQLHFSGDGTQSQLTVQVIPAVQSGCRTTYASEAGEQRRIYDFLESISVNVAISDEGIVTEERESENLPGN